MTRSCCGAPGRGGACCQTPLAASWQLRRWSFLGVGVARAGAVEDARPIIVWLCAEDVSPWLPCYGDSTVATPHIDRLTASSVRYANAFATSPVGSPARLSLMAGMYATAIGSDLPPVLEPVI
ncbi:MAG: hypothetical protein CMJ58_18630 [Planctomycetaceae bacterium]|nr:hypothetical protein [Planctomycetaceae bacterium]